MKFTQSILDGRRRGYRVAGHLNPTAAMLSVAMLIGFATTLAQGSGLMFQTLHAFHQGPSWPGPLVEWSDGNFYGVAANGGESGMGMVFRITVEGVLTPLVSFNGRNGSNPNTLLVGHDGNVYGTTLLGGAESGTGTIFKLTPDNTLIRLAVFNGTNGDQPSSLLEGRDGNFYGTTLGGGKYNGGTIFQLTLSGELTTLASFTERNASPNGLVQTSDGSFYGIANWGGIYRAGSIFRLTSDRLLTNVVTFNQYSSGTAPTSIILGNDGNIYGTTEGSLGLGMVFKLTPSGVFTTLSKFNGKNGIWPAHLCQGNDGNLYGTTTEGGTNNFGTVFRVTHDGRLTTLYSFGFPHNGTAAWISQARDGDLYGTAIENNAEGPGGSFFKVSQAGEFTKLFSFGSMGGYDPSALVQGNDGNFYGTTRYGGTRDVGTAFKLTPGGAFTTLASFDYTNGSIPSHIIPGSDGNFYGTAGYVDGPGTIFKLTPDGSLTNFFSFNGANGWWLNGLIQGSDGNLYGINGRGGKYDLGTVFRLSPSRELTTLVSFDGTNATFPRTLIQGSEGNFYGIAGSSGFFSPTSGSIIFKMTGDGSLSTLVSFNATNGYSASVLTQGSDGKLYVAAPYAMTDGSIANSACNCGTVFRLSQDGTMTPLLSFNGANGKNPVDLFEGTDGNFYGLTSEGGANDNGTVFKMTLGGALTTLYSFSGVDFYSLAYRPKLLRGIDGNLCGILTPSSGGGGAVFRLVEPPVLGTTRETDGKVTLRWNSFRGGAYRAEYKPTLLETNWTLLNPEVTAAGNTASVTDNPGSASERYYRVRLLP